MKNMKKNIKKQILTALTFSIIATPVFAGSDFDAGMRAYKQGNYAFAKTMFQQAIKKNYYDVDSRYMYCQLLMRDKQYDMAKQQYQIIIKAAPSSNAAKLAKQGLDNIDAYKARLAAEKAGTSQNRTLLVKKTANGMPTGAPVSTLRNVANNQNTQTTTAVKTQNTSTAATTEKKPEITATEYVKNAYRGGKKYLRPRGTTKVYVASDAKYKPMVIKAYREWQAAIGSSVMFSFVANKDIADDIVTFDKSDSARQGYCQYDFQGDYLVGNNLVIFSYKEDGSQKPDDLVYSTMLHEIGHSIGIAGHSPYPGDVMYQGARELYTSLSPRDKQTARLLYRSYGKAPELKDIQEAKEAELKDIAKRLPNSPSGLTDLGEEMLAAEKYDKAVEYFSKAASIEPSKDIYLRLIKAYTGLKDQDSVVACYKKILTIEKDKVDTDIVNNILFYYQNQGRIQEGKDFMDNMLKKYPNMENDPKVATWKGVFTEKNIKREEIRKRMINAAMEKKGR